MNKKQKTFYITTPIYYPSGKLHIGHLYTTSIAWTLRNFKQKNGYKTLFLTGVDEHGQKIEKKAIENNLPPQEYVDIHARSIKKLWKLFGIDYDVFSRTTKPKHIELIKKIFSQLLKEKLIYLGDYQGLYSVQDEEFFTKFQANKKDGKYYHPTSNHLLEIVKEKTYFFNMSKFQKWIKNYLNTNDLISNPQVLKELNNNFLDKNLEDLSVTRSSFSWGIPINEDPKHVVYVWLDALFNYVTMLNIFLNNNEKYLEYWQNGDEIVHVVGKEITRFHCIYWPIFLKALNLKLPTKILSHGWIITSEGKMSKSKGNVIDPLLLIKKYDAEILKYFLISKFNLNRDAIFDENLLKNTYNSDLANNIGNLLQRTLTMSQNSFSEPIKYQKNKLEDIDKEILSLIKKQFSLYKIKMDQFKPNEAFEAIFKLSSSLNNYIDLTKPWLLKTNLERLEIVLNTLLNGIYCVLTSLSIVMPEKMEIARKQLNIQTLSFILVEKFSKFDQIITQKGEIIFPRMK